MKFIHFAVSCSSQENSDLFYQEILGLKKIKESVVPVNIMEPIFAIKQDTKVVAYGNERLCAEVFIRGPEKEKRDQISHICIEVDNRQEFISRCDEQGLKKVTVKKGDAVLIFVDDFNGNRFEVKQK